MKASQGRYRLIAVVSLVDELVERILCGVQNKTEISNFLGIPSKPGVGFSQDPQIKAFLDTMRMFIDGGADSDVSGWDWCMSMWMLMLDAEIRIALNGSEGTQYARILRNRMICLGLSLFVLSDGSVYQQTTPGVMKSGSYLTSSTNSRVRWFLAMLIGADWAITAGDDCFEEYIDDAVAKYLELGIRIKTYKRSVDGYFEFCSNKLGHGSAIPLNWMKGLFRVLHSEYSLERFEQFKSEFRHSPMLEHCLQVLERVWVGHAFTSELNASSK